MKLLFGVAALLALTGCISIEDSGGGSRFVESPSPGGLGAAIFTKNVGFQDTAFSFAVRDPKVGAQKIEVGLVGDDQWKGLTPHAAVWSKDGTVIAVQGADFKGWSHAYDFQKHDLALSEVYPLPKRAAAIEQLLRSRGGAGQKVLSDWARFDALARPVESDERAR